MERPLTEMLALSSVFLFSELGDSNCTQLSSELFLSFNWLRRNWSICSRDCLPWSLGPHMVSSANPEQKLDQLQLKTLEVSERESDQHGPSHQSVGPVHQRSVVWEFKILLVIKKKWSTISILDKVIAIQFFLSSVYFLSGIYQDICGNHIKILPWIKNSPWLHYNQPATFDPFSVSFYLSVAQINWRQSRKIWKGLTELFGFRFTINPNIVFEWLLPSHIVKT